MPSTAKRENLRILFRFLFCNFLFTLLIGSQYLINSATPDSLLGFVFVFTAWISNFIPIYLLLTVILVPLYLVIKRWSVVASLTILLVMSLHLINFVDTTIFRLYKIHINSMVVNLLTTEGAGDALHLGGSTLVMLALMLAVALILQILLIWKLRRKYKTKKMATRRIIFVSIIVVVAVLPDKIIYAVSDLYNVREVTRFSRIFPLYQPVTVKGFMSRKFGFELDREDDISFSRESSGLNYPREPLTRDDGVQKPNILWILIDAYRYDMLNEETSPHIYEFSKISLRFDNHYSGGNASRFGVFSLFYGLYAYYWHQFLGERQSPVLIDELIELNYEFKIISSTRLTFPEFRKTAFVRIPDAITDNLLEGALAAEKDPLLTEEFLNWVDNRDTTRPFFSFLFYDAPHGPYSYPDEFEHFTPASSSPPNFITLGKSKIAPLKNGYKNAIRFDDQEVGKVLDAVKQRGLLDNTIVLISGDHGEEFYESSFYGHTSAFSRQQTQVPLLLYFPGVQPERISYATSHVDIPATFLSALGYKTDPAVYSQGKNILTDPEHDYVVSCGWADGSIITKDHVLVFSYETYNLGMFEVRDRDYREVENRREVINENRGYILEVLRSFEEFIK